MMFRYFILSAVLLTNAFAQNVALTSAGFPTARETNRSSAFAQRVTLDAAGFDSTYKLLLPKPVQDKNFYLLSLFQRNRNVRKLLSRDKALNQLAHDKLQALNKTASCNNVGCFDELIHFDSSTVEAVAAALGTLANEAEFKLLAKKDLRPSGVFIKYNSKSDAEMLVAAW